MRRIKIYALLALCFAVVACDPAYATGLLTGAASESGGVTVQETDGSPSVASVSAIKVTNGSLTDNGDGTVSIATSGAANVTVGTSAVTGGTVGGVLYSATGPVLQQVTGAGLMLLNSLAAPTVYAGSTCTNQILAALSAAGAGTCVTLTSAYVDSSILTNGGALGTPSSATLTNAVGLPILTGVSGLGAGVATFLATPSSGNLASALTNETGSGSVVFGTAPTIDSPTITTKMNPPSVTALPGSPSLNDIVIVTDDSAAGACDSAAGSARSWCQYNGVSWVAVGDGGSGGGSIGGSTGATDNAVLRANGTGGATVQSTGVIIDDTDNISGAASVQFGADPGDAGRVRLSNNESICFEANPTGTDGCITFNTSNEFEFNFPINITGTAGPFLMTAVASPSAPATAGQWYFYEDSVDGLPKYINNAGAEQTFYTTANPQTTVSGNAGTATALAANPSDCAANNFATTIAANGDLTCSQPSISAGVSGLGTGVATALGNNANATGGVATVDGTKTLTNTTIDCSSGTGNACTLKHEYYDEVAGCNNATAGAVWNLPTSNAAAAACDTGTNIFSAYLGFNDTTDQSYHGSFRLPTGFSGNIDWLFRYKMASATTGAVGWCVQLVRLPTGAAGDPALPAQAAGNCVSQTVPGTAGYESEATITGATCTSCAAGDRVFFRVSRDADGTAVTDSATGDARLVISGRAYAIAY